MPFIALRRGFLLRSGSLAGISSTIRPLELMLTAPAGGVKVVTWADRDVGVGYIRPEDITLFGRLHGGGVDSV